MRPHHHTSPRTLAAPHLQPGNGATEQPNVPTKFDPVPADTKTATITLGTFGALSLTRSPKL